MNRVKVPKTREELRRMALPQVRGWPGCADVRDVSVNLDEDGDWSIIAHVTGAHDAAAVNRATTAVRNELRKQYSLQTDT